MRFFLCTAVLLLMGCGPQRPPDVVLIVVDTLRADRLGCYGAEPSATPNLDRLATEGVRFDATMATSSWTGPTVASIVTGRYPDELGMFGSRQPLPDSVPNLADVLGAAGYQTLAVVSNGIAGPSYGHDRGYDEFYFESYKTKKKRGVPSFTADRVTDKALELWNRRERSRPVLLHVHYTDPHEPYMPPEEWRERYMKGMAPLDDRYLLSQGFRSETPNEGTLKALKAAYLAEIAFTDHEIGRLLDSVGSEPLVVFLSDHGEEFLEHDGFLHGKSLYEELVRVPFLVRGPGIPAGQVVSSPVSQVDLMPTLLEMTGIEGPTQFSGVSLLPRIHQGGNQERPLFALITGHRDWQSVRQGHWKLHVFESGRTFKLHNLEQDPGEQESVDTTPSEVLENLQSYWKQRRDNLAVVGQELDEEGDALRLEELKAMGYVK